MQRVFRVVETRGLQPVGPKTTNRFNRSVRRYGVLNPVLLAEVVDADGVIELAIIDGNRRIRAAKSARLAKVPAVVLKATTKQDRARLTLMCNYMRSANFHTESAAILSLAADQDAAAEIARTIGLGPVKMQQLYRKIATMPEPVRQAMYEHRIPVTAATWVGAWPEGLQRELIDLLGRRRYVNTTMMKELREWYAERHPEEFGIVEQPDDDVPFDEWSSTDLHVVNIPESADAADVDLQAGGASVTIVDARQNLDLATVPELPPVQAVAAASSQTAGAVVDTPASSQAPARTLAASGYTATVQPTIATPRPPADTPMPDRSPASREPEAGPAASRELEPEPVAVVDGVSSQAPANDRAEQLVAFVVRLDATLRDLACEGHELGIDRSIWVDRTMRAWDRIGD